MKSVEDSLRDRWHASHGYKRMLAIIEERLKKYRKEIDAIQKKGFLSGESNIRKRALDFYIGRNEELQNRIKEEALAITFSDLHAKSPNMPGFLNVTSKYIWWARLAAADIEQLDSIVNKFGSLGLSEYEIVLQLYRTDKKKYYKWVTQYIRKCLIPDVKNGVEVNHLLFARRKLILHALDQYSKRNYIVACSILTLQIEGLIHDALKDFNVFTEILRYEQLLACAKGEMYEGYAEVREQVLALEDELSVMGMDVTACHCDTLPENWIKDGAGKVWLLDWEYSGMNDPFWDIAAPFIEANFAKERESYFLNAYFDGTVPSTAERKVLIYKILMDYLWSIWARVKELDGDEGLRDYGLMRLSRGISNLSKL